MPANTQVLFAEAITLGAGASITLEGDLVGVGVPASSPANWGTGGITAGRNLGTVAGQAPTGGPYQVGDHVYDTTYQGTWLYNTVGGVTAWRLTSGAQLTARIYLAAATGASQSIVPFDTKDFDPLSMASVSPTTTSNITVLVAGFYSIEGVSQLNVAGSNLVGIYVNGSLRSQGGYAGASTVNSSATDTLKLAANDVVTLRWEGGATVSAGASAGYSTYLAVSFRGSS